MTPKASQADISAAFKQKSRTMHPDKVKRSFRKTTVGRKPTKKQIEAHAKEASDRYARLGLVNKVLLGEGRARYDHFLHHGFPAWKGTGYYYARFRPGFGSVLLGLFIFVGGAGHYLALYLNWKRQRDFLIRYINFARRQAWGDNLNIPGVEAAPVEEKKSEPQEEEGPRQPMNRRERRMQEAQEKKPVKGEKKEKKVKKVTPPSSGSATPSKIEGPKKKVVAENGKVLVVDQAGNVYLEERSGDGGVQEYLLDPEDVLKPTVRDTALVRLPMFLYRRTVGKFVGGKPQEEEEYSEGEEMAENAEGYVEVPEKRQGAQKVRSRKQGRK